MILIQLWYGYVLTGMIYAMYFVFWRLMQIDENAKQTSVFFKIIILPGIVLLWPFFLFKFNLNRKR